MHILVAPNAFKECLTADLVADALSEGCRRAADEITVDLIPLADGGDGTAAILSRHVDAVWKTVQVHDPLGRLIDAGFFCSQDNGVAIIEIAKASGLALLKDSEKNPMLTSSRGVGDLIRAALQCGVKDITVTLGGSATNDAGAGMAYALGFRFLDDHGSEVIPTGGSLRRIRSCHPPSSPDDRKLFEFLKRISLTVAVDVDSPLVGKGGATDKFSPQKGAKPENMVMLEEGLQAMLRLWQQDDGFSTPGFDYNGPGTGAAGGLGAGLVAFCGATMKTGFELVAEAVGLKARLSKADLVLTAEGMVDATRGKVPMSVGEMCQKLGKPCVAITGRMPSTADIEALNVAGISAGIFCLSPGPISLQQSMKDAAFLIRQVSEQVVRAFLAGTRCFESKQRSDVLDCSQQ